MEGKIDLIIRIGMVSDFKKIPRPVEPVKRYDIFPFDGETYVVYSVSNTCIKVIALPPED